MLPALKAWLCLGSNFLMFMTVPGYLLVLMKACNMSSHICKTPIQALWYASLPHHHYGLYFFIWPLINNSTCKMWSGVFACICAALANSQKLSNLLKYWNLFFSRSRPQQKELSGEGSSASNMGPEERPCSHSVEDKRVKETNVTKSLNKGICCDLKLQGEGHSYGNVFSTRLTDWLQKADPESNYLGLFSGP